MPDIVELINMPEHDVVKMIQLLVGEKRDKKLIVFGRDFEEYHQDILKNYLNENGLPFELWEGKIDKRGPGYFMSGAGKAEINREEKTILLFDRSTGYNMPPDRRRFEGAETNPPGWKIRF